VQRGVNPRQKMDFNSHIASLLFISGISSMFIYHVNLISGSIFHKLYKAFIKRWLHGAGCFQPQMVLGERYIY